MRLLLQDKGSNSCHHGTERHDRSQQRPTAQRAQSGRCTRVGHLCAGSCSEGGLLGGLLRLLAKLLLQAGLAAGSALAVHLGAELLRVLLQTHRHNRLTTTKFPNITYDNDACMVSTVAWADVAWADAPPTNGLELCLTATCAA